MRKKTPKARKPKRRVKKIRKPHTEQAFNIYHPDVNPQIEFAFECKGKQYYRMSHEFRLTAGRYKFLDAFLREHELRMTPKMFNDYLDKIEAQLNGRSGTIELSKIAVMIYNMRSHANLAFLPETIEKLASVVYFDETEDLRDYDPEYGKKKIAEWKEDGQYSFFLTRPIVELLNLEGISVTSLEKYMQSAQETIRELISDPSKPSSASS